MPGYDRPFRHLCGEAEPRDAMTEDQFWQHVTRNLTLQPDYDLDDIDCDAPEPDPQMAPNPCPVCGSYGPCFYDIEGRPLIHIDESDVDDGRDAGV